MTSVMPDITTSDVSVDTPVTISATSAGVTKTFVMTVKPKPPVSSITLDVATVTGGTTTNGAVNLGWTPPAGGATVTLTSSNPAAAVVAPSVWIADGWTTDTFAIVTKPVTTATVVTVAATYNGLSKSKTITVNPT
jgi:hypothetical protein